MRELLLDCCSTTTTGTLLSWLLFERCKFDFRATKDGCELIERATVALLNVGVVYGVLFFGKKSRSKCEIDDMT